MTDLHCYTNGTDTVVAYDEQDALTVCCEHLGEPRDDYEGDRWERIHDATPITIWLEEPNDACGCGEIKAAFDAETRRINALIEQATQANVAVPRELLVSRKRTTGPSDHVPGCPVGQPTKSAADWVQENGRGFLCSTEY